MCVSMKAADFSGTIGYVGEVVHPLFGHVHMLGYQNTARTLSVGGNAMLLHMPAEGLMTKENIIPLDSTKLDKSLLKNMRDDYFPTREKMSMNKGIYTNSARGISVFKSGIYDIALTNKPTLVNDVLDQIPLNKRPDIHPDLMAWYEERFPGWNVALCCFDNQQSIDADPIYWWYKPRFQDRLHFPAIDAHDGVLPKARSIWADHHILFGSDQFEEGGSANLLAQDYQTNYGTALTAFLPKRIMGRKFEGKDRNGDFSIEVSSLRRHRKQDFKRIEL